MSETVQRAISSGVVVWTQSGYRCELCDKSLTEVEPHLRGKDHFNNLAWEALRNPAPHPFLLDDIPRVVLEAKQRNELELVDKTVFSYRCLVCPKRPLSNGIRPLETHLKGREHENAKKIFSLPGQHPSNAPTQFLSTDGPQPRYPTGDPHVPPSMYQHNPPTRGGLPGVTGLDPEVQRALDEGVVQTIDGVAFRCCVCEISSTGVAPCLQHLRSGKHKKKVQMRRQQSLPDPQPPNPPLQQNYSSCAAAIFDASPLPIGGMAGATGYDPELQRALNDGVMERGVGQSFRCRVCDKPLTGAAPCLEHLRSDKHKGKAQTWTQLLPEFGQLTISSGQRSSSNFDSQPILRGRTTDPADGTWVFPWQVVTGSGDFPPSDIVYRNLSVPRGLVLIFNYCFLGHGEHERHGADRDSFNLKTLFRRMGYLVYLNEDKTRSQTEQALASTQNDPCLRKYDSLIVFILSHGKDDQIFYTNSLREEDCMRLDDVRNKFTDNQCPALKGKPKLFFVNFCRNKQQTSYDGMSPQRSEPLDMMTLYSCINTFRAPRDPERGTFFVQAWCEVLAAHAHDKELLELNFHVSQRMREMNGSVPEQQGYHFKKFYFNPVHTQ